MPTKLTMRFYPFSDRRHWRPKTAAYPWLKSIIIVALAVGLWLRLGNLGQATYWYDETFTSLRAAGYTEAEALQNLTQGGLLSSQQLQIYQQPARDRGLTTTLFSLATEDPQHPPFYYTIAHFWMRCLGSSPATIRLLSALCSLLIWPAFYWLSQELFAHPAISGLGIALLAVSPLQLLYAQEARQYSLWVALTFLNSAALLRAIRRQRSLPWLLYGLILIANFYTFLATGLLWLAQAIYVLVIRPVAIRPFLQATGLTFLAVLPWGVVVWWNRAQATQATDWLKLSTAPAKLPPIWLRLVRQCFWDMPQTFSTWTDRSLLWIGLILVWLLCGGVFALCRYTQVRQWALVLLLIMIPIALPAISDLALGGIRSTIPRYILPSLSLWSLVMAWILVQLWHGKHAVGSTSPLRALPQEWQRGRSLALIVVLMGFLSCIQIHQATTWWTKTYNDSMPEIARWIEQADRPLIISDADLADILSLNHLLIDNGRVNPAQVDWLLQPRCWTCPLRNQPRLSPYLPKVAFQRDRDIFLLSTAPKEAWLENLARSPYRVRILIPGREFFAKLLP